MKDITVSKNTVKVNKVKSFNVDDIAVTISVADVSTTKEDDNKRLAKYLYKLMEIGNRKIA